MTTTTELPIADAMTAADLLSNLNSLRDMLNNKNASISVVISARDQAPVYLSIRPDGYAAGADCHSVTGKTWSEAINAAGLWIATNATVRRDTTIRKMALAVIELTDERVKCTDAMLRRRDFSDEQIAELHELACARAGEMCGNSPFRVEFT